jgi:hypothetical protein
MSMGLSLGLRLGGSWIGGGAAVPIPANFQSVNADGWSVTYASPPTFDPVGSPEFFTVLRDGYDATGAATTIAENLVCTRRARQVFPNQASLTTDQVALSDYIYSTDIITGVTNNSTETSPKPVANWALADRGVCGDTLHLELVAFHRNGVAAVEFRATDGTTTVTHVVSEMTVLPAVGDVNAVLGYQCDLNLSTLADPATITVNAKVFPRIGGSASVLDSADQSSLWQFSPRSYRRDTVRFAAPYYVYVASGGDDATGAVSTDPAVASATPCATILGATLRLVAANTNVDHGVIRLKAGTHVYGSASSPSKKQQHTGMVVERDPATDFTDVTMTFGADGTLLRPLFESLTGQETILIIRNLQVQRLGSGTFNALFGVLRVTWENCTLDLGANVTAVYGSDITDCIQGLTVTSTASHGFLATAISNPRHRLIRGAICESINFEGWCVLGSDLAHPSGAVFSYPTSGQTGAIVGFNSIGNPTVLNGLISVGVTTGFAFIQNVVETTSASAGANIRISADSATASTSHVMFWHNTFTGFFSSGRVNLFYDEGATPRTHKLMSMRGNIWVQINNKGDVFVADGSRIGNWPYYYGTGCEGEFTQFIDAEGAGGFAQIFAGLRASIGTSNSVRNDPLFVDYQSLTAGPTAGAGGGDYRLQSGSPARGRVTRLLPFDLDGNPRAALASAGAYE